MIGLVLFTLALTSTGQLGLPSAPDEVPARVELSGDTVSKEGTLGRATGHAVLRAGTSVIRADELSYDYDPEVQVAVARGNVLLVNDGLVGFAKSLTLNLRTRELSTEDATFFQKQDVAPEVLAELAAQNKPLDLTHAGQNEFSFTTNRFRLLEDGAYRGEDLSFTASCGCNLLESVLRINSSSAELKSGERASFTAATVRVLNVPIFWVPWISLPLTDRASGLLMPEWTGSGLSGFQVDLPLFLTLGRSYDVTFSPGYAFGSAVDPGRGSLGVKGPRLATEFRYAPAPGVSGRLWFRLFDDLLLDRSPLNPDVLAPDAEQRGLRGWGIFEHRQELGHGFHARADVTLYSDGFLFADTSPANSLQRSYYYVPSTATLFHRGEDQYAGLALAYRQDIRWGYPLFGDAPRPPVFQELPTLRYALSTVPLFGPLTGSVQLELSRLSPLGGLLGDEGTDGVFWPTLIDPDETQGNGRFDPGERQARTRLDVLPRLNATFDLGGVLRVTPYLALRESLYFYEVTRETRNRAYGMVGLTLDSELSRVFGTGDSAIRHVIKPSVELRAVPRVFGQSAPQVYDEVDAAVTPNGFFQGQVAVRQKLLKRSGLGTLELGRLDLTQGVDFLERRLGESSGRLQAGIGPVSATATARLDLFTPQVQERLTQLSTSVAWNVLPNRRLSVGAGYERSLGSSERVRRPIDMLLPPPLPPPAANVNDGVSCSDGSALDTKFFDRVLLNAGTQLPFGLGARYEAEVYRRDPGGCDKLEMYSQALFLSYTPTCDCFQLEARAELLPPPTYFDVGLMITVRNLGSFGF